jgi:hypothetical protein
LHKQYGKINQRPPAEPGSEEGPSKGPGPPLLVALIYNGWLLLLKY